MPRLALCVTLCAMPLVVCGAANAHSGGVYTVCKLDPNGDNFLALRSCDSSTCEMIRQLSAGTFLLSWEPYSEGRWRAVTVMENAFSESATGPSGWVNDGYICKVPSFEKSITPAPQGPARVEID